MKYYDLTDEREKFTECPVVANDGNWNIVDTGGKNPAFSRFQALSVKPGCRSSSFGDEEHIVSLIRRFNYWPYLTKYGKQLFREYKPF